MKKKHNRKLVAFSWQVSQVSDHFAKEKLKVTRNCVKERAKLKFPYGKIKNNKRKNFGGNRRAKRNYHIWNKPT